METRNCAIPNGPLGNLFILPIRDGNLVYLRCVLKMILLFILPIRDGNLIFPRQKSTAISLFILPIRDGNQSKHYSLSRI